MSDGLIEDEFTNRPDDDELAFLHYEKLFREPLEKELAALQEASGTGIGTPTTTSCRLTSTA